MSRSCASSSLVQASRRIPAEGSAFHSLLRVIITAMSVFVILAIISSSGILKMAVISTTLFTASSLEYETSTTKQDHSDIDSWNILPVRHCFGP